MARNIYLNLEFGSGTFYEYSGQPKEGFEEHRNSKGRVTYRRYYKRGVYGIYRGCSIRDSKIGKELSIHLVDKYGNNVYMNMNLFDNNKSIASYPESFISFLPGLKVDYVYRVYPYALEKENGEGKYYGVSVKHADMIDEVVIENHEVPRLSYTRTELDGTVKEKGDIPAVKWSEHFDGSKVKDSKERDEYLYNVLTKHATGSSGISNKVEREEAPKPYSGGFVQEPVSNIPSQPASGTAAVDKKEPVTVHTQEDPKDESQKPAEEEPNKKLPF